MALYDPICGAPIVLQIIMNMVKQSTDARKGLPALNVVLDLEAWLALESRALCGVPSILCAHCTGKHATKVGSSWDE